MTTRTRHDDEDLDALFDRIVAERARGEQAAAAPLPIAARAAPANESVATPGTDGEAMFQRIGQLTRTLHDALRELGYDRRLEQAAVALPDAHERLRDVARLAGDAAERVLAGVERGQAQCAALAADARALDARWDALMAGELGVDAFRALAQDTRGFVKDLPARSGALHGELRDIMMAQDFHDRSGQVMQRVTGIVQRLEQDLLVLLVEACPAQARADEGTRGGPAVPGLAGADVVTGQAQVDQLLESLGF